MTITGVPSAVNPAAARIELLHDMLRVRAFEEKCVELYSGGRIRGFVHLYIGEEAVATGALHSLTAADNVVATYREHGHALVRGVPMRKVMAEMFGRIDGVCRGRGGSMHLFDAATRLFGGNAIVGGGIPLGVGLALADTMLGRDAVTATFFGDGAAAEGVFAESLNLAALWQVPVLFCCENNRYAMGTALAHEHAQTDIAAKVRAFGIPAETVDGMDADAVQTATAAAVAAMRADHRPRCLVYDTYRFRAHSMYDPELYRSTSEVAEWRERDPITVLTTRLQTEGHLDDAARGALDAEVTAEVDDAVAFAEASGLEPVQDLTRFIYAEEPR